MCPFESEESMKPSAWCECRVCLKGPYTEGTCGTQRWHSARHEEEQVQCVMCERGLANQIRSEHMHACIHSLSHLIRMATFTLMLMLRYKISQFVGHEPPDTSKGKWGITPHPSRLLRLPAAACARDQRWLSKCMGPLNSEGVLVTPSTLCFINSLFCDLKGRCTHWPQHPLEYERLWYRRRALPSTLCPASM